MSLSEADITLILMVALIAERIFKYIVKSCDDCNKRTKAFACKSACCEFMQRQRSNPQLDVGESATPINTPDLRAALERLNARLQAAEKGQIVLASLPE